jgi:hypothetical protein
MIKVNINYTLLFHIFSAASVCVRDNEGALVSLHVPELSLLILVRGDTQGNRNPELLFEWNKFRKRYFFIQAIFNEISLRAIYYINNNLFFETNFYGTYF